MMALVGAGAGAGGYGAGANIPLRLRDLGLGFYASAFLCPNTLHRTFNSSYCSSASSSSFACSESPRNVPILSGCFSHQEDNHVVHSEELSSVTGGFVALGKFDALHIGHRELAIQASKAGHPFLLSFVGMAEVLGWEPRPPIVAKCDRKRVLSSWAPYCDDVAPKEVEIEFSSVRHLSAQEFVEKLSKELRVRGVVAGENYRFGYKAAGDAAELVRLCEEYSIRAYIINSVMDTCQFLTKIPSHDAKDAGQVSSTRVRRALAVGDMRYVSELLGRPHRLILKETNAELFSFQKNKISASKLCLSNLAPREGLYENCSLLVGELGLRCRVVIDTANIHIEMGDEASYSNFGSEDPKLLSIEFGSTNS